VQFIGRTPLILITLASVSCGGGSNSPTPQSAAPAPTQQVPASSVIVSGKITYDRVPHTENSGLDYANAQKLPARGVFVEAIDSSNAILATTTSDSYGDYSFSLKPNTKIRIRSKAQLLSEGSAKWNFQVTDNTQNNSLYALQGSLVSTGSSARQSRDLHAAHGWTGQTYGETRSAAPFAIIDTVFTAVQTFTDIDPNIAH